MPLPIIGAGAAAAARAGTKVIRTTGRAGARAVRSTGRATRKTFQKIRGREGKKKKERKIEKEGEEKAETEQQRDMFSPGGMFSPAGLIMLPLAAIIDIIDFFTGSLLILDIVAILVIGGWIYSRSGQLKVTRGAAARLGKAAKWAKKLRWLRPLLIAIEFIPIVGMLPLWVLLVYFELKQ